MKMIAVVGLLVVMVTGAAGQTAQDAAAVKDHVDFTKALGRVEGFGFSEAFEQGNAIKALPETKRKEVLDLLMSRDKGAGFNIVRLGIDTDSLMEEKREGGPGAKAVYKFDGVDGGQVWFANQAQAYGVTRFMADAWTAPPFMKTKESKVGGSLCGVTGAVCASGDWKKAFSEYLVEWVRAYKRLGIGIGWLGFSNEPDITVPYASMDMTPGQAVELMRVFGPVVRAAGLGLKVTCCDASTWASSAAFLETMDASDAKGFVDVVAAHEYGVHATAPLKTERPVWMTEWSSGLSVFNAQWDCGPCAGGPDGMYLAHDVVQAWGKGGISAYVYWWGASTGPAALVHLEGDGYTVAKRFYAIAAVSRFVQAGAQRVEESCANAEVDVAAFRNPDGSEVLVALNRSLRNVDVKLEVDTASAGAGLTTYLTDAGHSVEEVPLGTLAGQTLSLNLRRRGLVTAILTPKPGAVRH
jgi:glucuronoarabinoxylan endo-1,4-beta-xylanase